MLFVLKIWQTIRVNASIYHYRFPINIAQLSQEIKQLWHYLKLKNPAFPTVLAFRDNCILFRLTYHVLVILP
jgi:hypothetical protein